MPIAEKLNKQQLSEFEEMEEEVFLGYFEAGEENPLISEREHIKHVVKFGKGNYYVIVKIYLSFKLLNPGIRRY